MAAKKASQAAAASEQSTSAPAAPAKGKSEKSKAHPQAGWVKAEDESVIGDGTGIMDVQWSDEDLSALEAMLDGKTEDNVIPEPAADERRQQTRQRSQKPAQQAQEPQQAEERPRDEKGRFLPLGEQEPAADEHAEDGAEPVGQTAEGTPPDDGVGEPAPASTFRYKTASGEEMELTHDQVRLLISRAENSIENEEAAIERAQRAFQEAQQLRAQINQLQQIARAGRVDAFLQLVGAPAPTHGVSVPVSASHGQQAPAAPRAEIDWSGVDLSDPAQVQQAMQRAFAQYQQSFQAQFDQRMRAEEERRAAAEAERQQREAVTTWATGVEALADRLTNEHPGLQRMTPRQRAAVRRDVDAAVLRAYQAGRFTVNSDPRLVQRIVQAAVESEVGAWLTESRQGATKTIQQLQTAQKDLPKKAAPKTAPTIQPRGRSAPPADFDDPRKFTDDLLNEYRALIGDSNLELGI